jgi:hypothetical protein
LGALINTELTLRSPTNEERANANVSVSPMEVSIVEDVNEIKEDIRDIALRMRDIIQLIVGHDKLEDVTPKEFSDAVKDPNRLDDDTFQDSLKYLLTRENALRDIVGISTLTVNAPATTLSDAALSKDMPLIIWVLVVNTSGDAQAAMPFSSVEKALSNVGSSS